MVWLTVVQGRMMERRGKEREREGKGGKEKESREITRRAFACMRAGERREEKSACTQGGKERTAF